MKTLYLDCGMGAAGDMLSAALLELVSDGAACVAELNALGIPGVEYVRERAVKCGIVGTHLSVLIHGAEEEHHHEHHEHEHHEHEPAHEHHKHEHHEHTHEHHHHQHSGMGDIAAVINALPLPETVRADALAVYGLIAEAEAHVHGVPVSDIHFHEVGTLDAVADVAAACLLLHYIAPDEIVCSPVSTGTGQVRCAHGILPVPAPAAAYLLRDIPIQGGSVEGELCTPTGAALLRHFVTRYGEMPPMRPEKIGYGMGTRDYPRANCVRAILGEAVDGDYPLDRGPLPEGNPWNSTDNGGNPQEADGGKPNGTANDSAEPDGTVHSGEPSGAAHGVTDGGADACPEPEELLLLSCNVDDMTGEELGFAMECLLEGGAREAYTVPVGMKKSRPGVLLEVLCGAARREDVLRLLFRHTTTLGVREMSVRRYALARETETRETGYGPVRRKRSHGWGAAREKYEYEDLARIARERGISLREARELAERE